MNHIVHQHLFKQWKKQDQWSHHLQAPGDSIRDFFIPQLEVTFTTFEFGSRTTIPRRAQQNCQAGGQAGIYIYIYIYILYILYIYDTLVFHRWWVPISHWINDQHLHVGSQQKSPAPNRIIPFQQSKKSPKNVSSNRIISREIQSCNENRKSPHLPKPPGDSFRKVFLTPLKLLIWKDKMPIHAMLSC